MASFAITAELVIGHLSSQWEHPIFRVLPSKETEASATKMTLAQLITSGKETHNPHLVAIGFSRYGWCIGILPITLSC